MGFFLNKTFQLGCRSERAQMLEERGLCLKPKGTLCLKRRNLRLTKPEPSLVIQTTIALTSPMITSQIIFSFIGGHCAGEINLKGHPHKLKK